MKIKQAIETIMGMLREALADLREILSRLSPSKPLDERSCCIDEPVSSDKHCRITRCPVSGTIRHDHF